MLKGGAPTLAHVEAHSSELAVGHIVHERVIDANDAHILRNVQPMIAQAAYSKPLRQQRILFGRKMRPKMVIWNRLLIEAPTKTR